MTDYPDYAPFMPTRSKRYQTAARVLSGLCVVQMLMWIIATFLPLTFLGWVLVAVMGCTSLCSAVLLRVMSVSDLRVRSERDR